MYENTIASAASPNPVDQGDPHVAEEPWMQEAISEEFWPPTSSYGTKAFNGINWNGADNPGVKLVTLNELRAAAKAAAAANAAAHCCLRKLAESPHTQNHRSH